MSRVVGYASDDDHLCFIHRFVEHVAGDFEQGSHGSEMPPTGSSYLNDAFKAFECKLSDESSDNFQIDASATLLENHQRIIRLLDSHVKHGQQSEVSVLATDHLPVSRGLESPFPSSEKEKFVHDSDAYR
ncbi:uncharacterized protein KD926_010208 [Aspergillus affinis]|uniref:uncharacterized protein n=1 Tax=Aspergillus affinis TaxID=1070780 RepID=UPI0022FDBB45|nr:uncharacterized protein KD926_010208 [Aspergillus affinis]KAI9038875.1 hypothetical protein KD926_010208 [Aspergillus affinis]